MCTELREFAQGIHPQLLTEGGLWAALSDLVRRAPVPVELRAPDERVRSTVEAAVCFVCSEALANIGKHAPDARATINVTRTGDRFVVAVHENGGGGATLDGGSGLRGLADRVEELGGRLAINSLRGEGTTLVAEFRLDS